MKNDGVKINELRMTLTAADFWEMRPRFQKSSGGLSTSLQC